MLKRHLSVATACLLLAACSYGIGLRVSGSLADGIVFEPSHKPIEVVSIWVYEYTGITEPPIMWRVDGKAKLRSVKYSAVPEGMKEIVAATPLKTGATYIVSVSVKCPGVLSPPTCPGETGFKVLPNGSITGW